MLATCTQYHVKLNLNFYKTFTTWCQKHLYSLFSIRFHTGFDDIMQQEHRFHLLHDGWNLFEVWTMFLLKNWPFCGRFRRKYDWAVVWDVILYHIINFRKVWILTKIIRVRYHQDNYLMIKVACWQDARVLQFSPISGCIEHDLKFWTVILWSKDRGKPRRHSHTW